MTLRGGDGANTMIVQDGGMDVVDDTGSDEAVTVGLMNTDDTGYQKTAGGHAGQPDQRL